MHKQAYDASGSRIGTFDGEFLYNMSGNMALRVDGDEVYTTEIPCKYIGVYENNEARTLDGSLLFRAEE
ncbi:hypothetical protein [Stutzerimonas nitrititolerans]|uniref:hypothetical protein n=1 Tax=Stutzerimonas nitrititolerans TaxID=2482751 RepID=UPI001BDD7263|nr:hypothetical protein [Stutzerimonas nitrititolerans]MBT1120206.1 hypothetical protein [Stutzerimonas nitrititolerans]